jgi:hypothetical protein
MELQQEFVSTVSPNIGTLELEPVSGPAVTPVRQHTDTTPPVSTVPTDPSMGSPAASAQPTVELMSGASCAEASPSLRFHVGLYCSFGCDNVGDSFG